jgi:hypothetical protein
MAAPGSEVNKRRARAAEAREPLSWMAQVLARSRVNFGCNFYVTRVRPTTPILRLRDAVASEFFSCCCCFIHWEKMLVMNTLLFPSQVLFKQDRAPLEDTFLRKINFKNSWNFWRKKLYVVILRLKLIWNGYIGPPDKYNKNLQKLFCFFLFLAFLLASLTTRRHFPICFFFFRFFPLVRNIYVM